MLLQLLLDLLFYEMAFNSLYSKSSKNAKFTDKINLSIGGDNYTNF